MRVMQLHIEELMRQSEQREKELQKTQAQLKEHAKQRAVQQPQERKLFARLEQLQAELKTARELRSKAEAHSVDLQQQLEQVVMAAERFNVHPLRGARRLRSQRPSKHPKGIRTPPLRLKKPL